MLWLGAQRKKIARCDRERRRVCELLPDPPYDFEKTEIILTKRKQSSWWEERLKIRAERKGIEKTRARRRR